MSHSPEDVRVYDLFKNFLTDNGIHFQENEDNMRLECTITAEDLPQPTIIRIMEKQDLVQIISPLPFIVPEDKRLDMAVAVSVANDHILNGSFDLNFSHGGMCFRVSQSYVDMELSKEFARYFFSIAVMATDQYNDLFFMLSKGMMSLEQFIEEDAKRMAE